MEFKKKYNLINSIKMKPLYLGGGRFGCNLDCVVLIGEGVLLTNIN